MRATDGSYPIHCPQNAFSDLKPGNILIGVEDLESVVKRELADHTPEVVDAAGLASWFPTVTRYKSQPLPLPKIIDTSTVEIKIADFGTCETTPFALS